MQALYESIKFQVCKDGGFEPDDPKGIAMAIKIYKLRMTNLGYSANESMSYIPDDDYQEYLAKLDKDFQETRRDAYYGGCS